MSKVRIYLGEVQSTRRIKKLVLTGEEKLFYNTSNYCGYVAINDGLQDTIAPYCDDLQGTIQPSGDAPDNSIKQLKMSIEEFACGLLIKCTSGFNDLASFKTWLSNNTPTVWYVLATPETGIVNEPLRKIGDYADEVSGITIPTIAGANTISVDTTLQPSEVSVNYKGWHPVADVHERENGAWI